MKVRPDLFEPRHRAPPMHRLRGEHTGRHGAGGRPDDHLKRAATPREYFRERAKNAHLIGGTRPAPGEHEPEDGSLIQPPLCLRRAFGHWGSAGTTAAKAGKTRNL